MFITFGLDANDTPDRIREYVKYGVEEFFAGFVPRDWLSKYGWEVCPKIVRWQQLQFHPGI